MAVLVDGRTVWLVWAAAGLGWGLGQGAPLAAESLAGMLRTLYAGRLRAERAALLEAWQLAPPASAFDAQERADLSQGER
jgi:hypothetical protein